MKQWRIRMCTALFALSVFMHLPFVAVVAQTHFEKHSGNPILPLGNAGEWDDTEAAFAHVLYDGSTYHMWYSGAPNANTYRIGYATSADGIGWNKQGMALGNGAPGSFDGTDTWLPWVLFDGSQYEMWYTGNLSGGGIGYITTNDPTTWTRQRTTPVLSGGGSGAWDYSRVLNPVVIRSDTLYQMWYSAESASGIWQTGYATSTDGVNWSKHPNNPVLTVGASSEWDAVAAMAGTVLFENGEYHMWYHGTSGNAFSGWEIGYATSPDGITWTKDPGNPILSPTPSNWDSDIVGFPRVIKNGDRYQMWYSGRTSGNSIDRLGYAEDSNGIIVPGTVHNKSVTVAGTTRTYLLYEPHAYTGQDAWPLVVNYHGHQSNATNQMEIHSKMNAIADTAHFLIAYPQGLEVFIPGFGTAPGWNSPGIQAAQNDVDFTDSLLYDIKKDFNIDTTRIHATGWSNGSIFSFWLAFKRPDVFASVAGVAGPITLAMLDSFSTIRPMSALYMHGTADPVVNYHNGYPNLTGPAQETPAFWVNHNNCNPDSIVTELPDVDPNDGSTVTRIEYAGCDANTEVLFYRVNNGGHGWPGGSPPNPFIGNTNYDITASSEIWNFFKRNSHPDLVTGIADDDNFSTAYRLHQNYPNPFNPSTTIEFTLSQRASVTLKVFDLLGKEVATLVDKEVLAAGNHHKVFDARHLASGIYLYHMRAGSPSTGSGQAFTQTRKLVLLK